MSQQAVSREIAARTEGAGFSPSVEWVRLDAQAVADMLDLCWRKAELERDSRSDERLQALRDELADLSRKVVFCRFCLLAATAVLAFIALKL